MTDGGKAAPEPAVRGERRAGDEVTKVAALNIVSECSRSGVAAEEATGSTGPAATGATGGAGIAADALAMRAALTVDEVATGVQASFSSSWAVPCSGIDSIDENQKSTRNLQARAVSRGSTMRIPPLLMRSSFRRRHAIGCITVLRNVKTSPACLLFMLLVCTLVLIGRGGASACAKWGQAAR
jgi:hypothetical protein